MIDQRTPNASGGFHAFDDISKVEEALAQRDEWIAYADKLERAIERMCGMSKNRLLQMHGEEALRIVKPARS